MLVQIIFLSWNTRSLISQISEQNNLMNRALEVQVETLKILSEQAQANQRATIVLLQRLADGNVSVD